MKLKKIKIERLDGHTDTYVRKAKHKVNPQHRVILNKKINISIEEIEQKLVEIDKHFATHDNSNECYLNGNDFDYSKVTSYPISVDKVLKYYLDSTDVQNLLKEIK